jgi:predicted AAA+ superfamily ATPase
MFVQRTLAPQLQQAAREYPVVTVTGPRQAGKTTLVRAVFPNHTYVNLEQPEIRRLAQEDPQQFFHMHSGPVILDEIQRVPELLSWVQVRADETKRRGEFILTGSHQMELGQAISQSLAGRTALLTLLPFSMAELSDAGVMRDKNEWMYRGFLPRVTAESIEPTRAYADYFRTYVERDVRQMMEIRNLTRFENFMRLLAGRAGQILNLMSLSADVGVSSTTLREWLSILEASFVVFRLPPYYRNYGKRLIKSPKIYFHETGLLCWLLGIESAAEVARDPLHGQVFENLVVTEAMKARLHAGRESRLYFWQDSNRNEVDLLWENQRKLIPLEIKSAMTWNREFSANVAKFQHSIPDAAKGYVVYAGDLFPEDEHFRAVHFSKVSQCFQSV